MWAESCAWAQLSWLTYQAMHEGIGMLQAPSGRKALTMDEGTMLGILHHAGRTGSVAMAELAWRVMTASLAGGQGDSGSSLRMPVAMDPPCNNCHCSAGAGAEIQRQVDSQTDQPSCSTFRFHHFLWWHIPRCTAVCPAMCIIASSATLLGHDGRVWAPAPIPEPVQPLTDPDAAARYAAMQRDLQRPLPAAWHALIDCYCKAGDFR